MKGESVVDDTRIRPEFYPGRAAWSDAWPGAFGGPQEVTVLHGLKVLDPLNELSLTSQEARAGSHRASRPSARDFGCDESSL